MDKNTKEQLEQYCKEYYQKIVDSLTKFAMDLFEDLYSNLPDVMSEEDKVKFIKELIETQADGLVGSATAFDVRKMHTDMEQKLKGEANG